MLTEGQTVYWMYGRDKWNPSPAVVGKCGRRWAPLLMQREAVRIDIHTMEVESRPGHPWGYAFVSKEMFDTAKIERQMKAQTEAAWVLFRRAVNRCWRPPEGMTIAIMEQAAALLKVEVPSE